MTTNLIVYEQVVVPESSLLKRERSNRYGSVPGLDDEELANPDELERCVMRAEWGPVLALPVKDRKGWIQRNIDEDGRIDFGAFATVDFDRHRPSLDKARFKADKLKEQLRDLVIMISIVNERIEGKAKYKVLKYVKMGIMEVDDISNWDLWHLANFYLRALRLRKEIVELKEASRRRKEKQLQAWLDSLG